MPNKISDRIAIFNICVFNASYHDSLIFSKDWDLNPYDPSCDINSSPAFKYYPAIDYWTRNTSFKIEIGFTNNF
jgi:hypothetical protein